VHGVLGGGEVLVSGQIWDGLRRAVAICSPKPEGVAEDVDAPVTFSPANRWMRLIYLLSSLQITFEGPSAVGPPEDPLALEVTLLAEGVRQPGGHLHLTGPSILGQGDVPSPLRAADVDEAPGEARPFGLGHPSSRFPSVSKFTDFETS
jgi:hypothetical protein